MKEIKDLLLRVRWWMFHLNRRQLYRWLYKAVRPGSDPYISGDGFRRLARHVYDETNQNLRPGAVRDGDLVFVSTEYVYRFFQEVEPGIRSSYRLITHNSDVPADEAIVRLASDRTEIWFALNNTREHPKVVPIPIGLENAHHYYAGVPADFDAARTRTPNKKPRILSGFTIATNPVERQHVHDVAAKAPSVDQIPVRLNQAEYLQTLAGYKFLLCPPGNGLDTHRTWEAMYLRVIPIVKDSVPTRAFERQGLPLWVLSHWEDLLDFSEGDLEAKYAELEARFSAPALWMDYWKRLISRPQDSNELIPGLVQERRSGQSPRAAR